MPPGVRLRPSCVLVRRACGPCSCVYWASARRLAIRTSVTSVVPCRCCDPGAPPPRVLLFAGRSVASRDGGQLVKRGFHLLGGFERAVRRPALCLYRIGIGLPPMPASGVVGGWVTPSPLHAQAFLPSPLRTSLPILVHGRFIFPCPRNPFHVPTSTYPHVHVPPRPRNPLSPCTS